MAIAVLIAGFVVNAWLLIIVCRQKVREQLPWFALYVVWELLLVCVQLVSWVVIPRLYITLYWWMEIIEVVLIVGAVRESLLRIFQGFTSKPGFRWAVWSVIGAVVVYSAWKAVYFPPIQGGRLAAFVIGAEFMFRWGIFGIAFLTTVLSALLKEPMNTREDAVVSGFGIASICIVATTAIVSFFGKRYLFISSYLPSVGYFVAAFWWIWVFSRPVQEFGFKELGMGPEGIARELRTYSEAGERRMRKNGDLLP